MAWQANINTKKRTEAMEKTQDSTPKGRGTIIFWDEGDEIKCRVSFDPPLDLRNEDVQLTPAQQMTLEKWQILMQSADGIDGID